jgi:HK97 family phage portal protein
MAIESLGSLISDSGQRPLLDVEARAADRIVGVNGMTQNQADSFRGFLYGGPTISGVTVNQHAALGLSTVLACVRILSSAVAMMPLVVHRKTGPDTSEPATDHYLYPILGKRVNTNVTSFRWKRMMMVWAALNGNAIATYDVLGNGQVANIKPISPDRVTFYPQADGSLRYGIRELQTDGLLSATERLYSHEKILHIRGLEVGDNGIGLSVISQARQALGQAIATEQYGASMFEGGALVQGFFKTPGKMSAQAQDNFSKSFDEKNKGLGNAHKRPILEQGIEFTKLSIDPVDVQWLESRKFSVEEICRWFGIQPRMVGSQEKNSRASVEQEGIEFISYTLGMWLENMEQEIETTFLSAMEQNSYFVKFNTDVLLRGDMTSRFAAYANGIQNGFVTPNQARSRESWNPLPNGDELLVNGTMIPLSIAVQKTLSDPVGAPVDPSNPEVQK